MPHAGIEIPLWPERLDCYDISLSTGVENLALDEAILASVEAGTNSACLRFWQSNEHIVVLGRSNRIETEVNQSYCDAAGIPILRRASGGGTVLIGPGCLCYSLVLPLTETHRHLGVSRLTSELMSNTASGLRSALTNVEVQGTSDLVCNGRKFSGNAQRWLRKSFIHQGTLLFDFDVTLLAQCLAHPTREPTYRQSRQHGEFVANVDTDLNELKRCLRSAWNAIPAVCASDVREEAFRIANSTLYASS